MLKWIVSTCQNVNLKCLRILRVELTLGKDNIRKSCADVIELACHDYSKR